MGGRHTYNGEEQKGCQFHFLSHFSHLSDGALSEPQKENIIGNKSSNFIRTDLPITR
jgi:hypothetical protein